MKRHTPTSGMGPGDGRLARLAAQVDRLDQQLATLPGLRADVDAHTAAITRLAEALTHTTGRDPEADAAAEAGNGRGSVPPTGGATGGDRWPRDWMTVTEPDHAVLWLDELSVWVRKVWKNYQPLTTCWIWHPVVVAELLAAQASWVAATSQGAFADALSVWHDRWQPGAAGRISRQLAGCERADGHHVDGAQRFTPDPAVLDEVAAWWATAHGTDPNQPAPGLTPTNTAGASSSGLLSARTRQETYR